MNVILKILSPLFFWKSGVLLLIILGLTSFPKLSMATSPSPSDASFRCKEMVIKIAEADLHSAKIIRQKDTYRLNEAESLLSKWVDESHFQEWSLLEARLQYEIHYELGWIYFTLKNYEMSQNHFVHAINLDERNSSELHPLISTIRSKLAKESPSNHSPLEDTPDRRQVFEREVMKTDSVTDEVKRLLWFIYELRDYKNVETILQRIEVRSPLLEKLRRELIRTIKKPQSGEADPEAFEAFFKKFIFKIDDYFLTQFKQVANDKTRSVADKIRILRFIADEIFEEANSLGWVALDFTSNYVTPKATRSAMVLYAMFQFELETWKPRNKALKTLKEQFLHRLRLSISRAYIQGSDQETIQSSATLFEWHLNHLVRLSENITALPPDEIDDFVTLITNHYPDFKIPNEHSDSK